MNDASPVEGGRRGYRRDYEDTASGATCKRALQQKVWLRMRKADQRPSRLQGFSKAIIVLRVLKQVLRPCFDRSLRGAGVVDFGAIRESRIRPFPICVFAYLTKVVLVVLSMNRRFQVGIDRHDQTNRLGRIDHVL